MPNFKPTGAVKDTAVSAIAEAEMAFNPAAGSELTIAPVKNNVTFGDNTLFADIELADFTGADPIECGAGTPDSLINPINGRRQLRLVEPAGGFQWQTDDDANLPQTIYGYALLNNAGDSLKGYLELETPIELTARKQVIDCAQPIFEFPNNFMG